MSNLTSCRSKKVSTQRTQISDTLIKVEFESKTKPIDINYKFDLVCDTISGEVRPVSFQEQSGDNLADLRIENNQLLARLKIAETTNKVDSTYQKEKKEVIKEVEVVKFRTPFWHWIVHGLFLIAILYKLRKIFLP